MKKAFLILAALALAAGGCKTADTAGTFTDSRDGKKYKTVKIGKQVWMAENLSYEAEGSKCYGDDPANCEKYGRLYDWETAKTACPAGWRLPSGKDLATLEKFAGGNEVVGKKLKAKSGWNENGNGTDEYGFSALPSGGNAYGEWWGATENDEYSALAWDMYYERDNVGWYNERDKSDLRSVRCVKDTDEQTAKITMPPQSFVGTWSNDKDDYLQINEINAEDNRIVFVWADDRVSSRLKEGTAKIEDGKIKFVIQDWTEGASVEATGTMAFDENGISLTVEKSDAYKNIAGQTFHYRDKKATAASGGENAGVIELEKLTLKGDVYYLNNALYTGTARKEEKDQYDHLQKQEKWEMKDGRFHGKYTADYPAGNTVGTYKDGKKHGEWKDIISAEYEFRGPGEWKFFSDGELYKTETWENGVLVKERPAMPSQSFVGTWRGEGVDYDSSYITIWNIFDEGDHKEVDFAWYIANRISVAAIANIKDGKIFFITRDESEHTGEEYHRISGTMEFNENGVSLTVEESKDSDIIAGQTFHYKNKKQ